MIKKISTLALVFALALPVSLRADDDHMGMDDDHMGMDDGADQQKAKKEVAKQPQKKAKKRAKHKAKKKKKAS